MALTLASFDDDVAQEERMMSSDTGSEKRNNSTKLQLPQLRKSVANEVPSQVSLRQTVVNWFCPFEADELQSFFVASKASDKPRGAGPSEHFARWIDDPPSILWCTGAGTVFLLPCQILTDLRLQMAVERP